MKNPDQDDIEFWINQNKKILRKRNENIKSGWYQQEDIPIHSAFSGAAMDYAGLGRARFLNGEAINKVNAEFSTAAKCMLKCFTMAYDLSDPNYVGDKPSPPGAPSSGYGEVDWSDVMETNAIDGFNYALMGADFDTARELAGWYQDSKDGHKMDAVVNRYTYAYKYALSGQLEKGLPLQEKSLEKYAAKPPKTGGDMNYFTLSIALYGILKRDEALFNEGLALQLAFYKNQSSPQKTYGERPMSLFVTTQLPCLIWHLMQVCMLPLNMIFYRKAY